MYRLAHIKRLARLYSYIGRSRPQGCPLAKQTTSPEAIRRGTDTYIYIQHTTTILTVIRDVATSHRMSQQNTKPQRYRLYAVHPHTMKIRIQLRIRLTNTTDEYDCYGCTDLYIQFTVLQR